MPHIKLSILLALSFFSAHSVYQAEKKISESRSIEKRSMLIRAEKDGEFMNRAIELSFIALKDHREHPFGCVVVKEGKIVGEGWNNTKALNDSLAHAEREAIRNVCQNLDSCDLTGCTIYASTQPCSMCLSLIHRTGINKIFYCIPMEKIAVVSKALSIKHTHKAVSKSQVERSVPEIAMMQEEVDGIISRYLKFRK